MSEPITAIIMPKLGLSMTEGSVVEWRVSPGSEVSSGDVVADIETSKIVNELEVHTSGVFRRGLVDLGVDVPVGALIGVMSNADVPEADIDAFVAAFTAGDGEIAAAESAGAADATPSPVGVQTESRGDGAAMLPESLAGSYDAETVFATHHAHKLAQSLGLDLGKVTGTGRRGRISKHDIRTAVVAAGGALGKAVTEESFEPLRSAGQVKTTPVAKRLADQYDVDLTLVPATGSRGRISKGDVLTFIEQQQGVPAVSQIVDAPGDNPFEEETLSRAREIIASRLSESKSTAPHYRLSVDVIIDKLLELRRDIEQGEPETRVSVNDMLVRATALALTRHPGVNIQFDGRTIRRFTHADIAVAVALDEGLVTPIIRQADQKDLIAIATEVAELVERARAGKLLPDEFQGGTFTLSNLGMFGIKSFDAIINPPQAAIMAIGKAERRLYVGEEDSGRVATFMTVTMSCDHRVIDGATGAKFLQTFKDILHHPGRLLL